MEFSCPTSTCGPRFADGIVQSLLLDPAKALWAQKWLFRWRQPIPSRLLSPEGAKGKISPVKEDIQKINPKIEVIIVTVDLCSQDSIRTAAADINASIDSIDVLLKCAGTMVARDFTPSADGIENQYAAIQHFLLTSPIAGRIAKDPTYVTVT